jgi:hypothetical protein
MMKNSAVMAMMSIQHNVDIDKVNVVSLSSQWSNGAIEYEFEVTVYKESYTHGFEKHIVRVSSQFKEE